MDHTEEPTGYKPQLEDLDTDQKAALHKMSLLFAPYNEKYPERKFPEDFTLNDNVFLRYLRYCHFNVEKAATKLRATLKWRRQWRIDDILSNPPDRVKRFRDIYIKNFPNKHLGLDRWNRPIYTQMSGKACVEVLVKYASVADVILCHAWDMEYQMRECRRVTERTGKLVDTVVNVVDLSGWGVNSPKMLPYLQNIARIDDEHYPGTLGCTIVINAPQVFPVIWKSISVFQSKETQDKLWVIPSPAGPKLLESIFVTSDKMPSEYGGDMKVEWGTQDEETNQLECEEEFDSHDKIELYVSAGTIEKVVTKIDAKDDRKTFAWWFKTDYNNISFGVNFIDSSDDSKTVVVPVSSIDSHHYPIEGTYVLPKGKSGHMVTIFDNYASYMNPKYVKHELLVRETKEDDLYYSNIDL